jgi:hypothetical protein
MADGDGGGPMAPVMLETLLDGTRPEAYNARHEPR